MKDKNGIKICCKNCATLGFNGGEFYEINADFAPIEAAYQARIAELQAVLADLKKDYFDKIINGDFTTLFRLRRLTEADFEQVENGVSKSKSGKYEFEETSFRLKDKFDDDLGLEVRKCFNLTTKELCWHSLDFKISDGNGDYDEMHFEGDTFADVLESFNNYRAECYLRLGLVPHAAFITTMRDESEVQNG